MAVVNDKEFFQQIFNLKSKILLMIIFLNAISSVSIEALGILSDEELVERLVIDLSHVRAWKTNWMKRLRGQSICHMAPKMKLYLCQLYLKEVWNDLEYTWPLLDPKSVDCTEKRCSLRILDETLLKLNSVSGYECPSTNEGEFLLQQPLIYMSESPFENSALVFVRKNQSSPLFPHRLIDGFTFKQLTEESGRFLKFVERKSPFRGRSSLVKIEMDRNNMFGLESAYAFNVVEWRLLRNPYRKFIQFYSLLSICSLSNLQKLNVCRLIKNRQYAEKVEFEFDEDQVLRCEKQTIFYRMQPRIRGLEKKTVPIVKCPVLVVPEEDEEYKKIRKIYSSFHFFLSTCAESDCLIIYEIMTHFDETKHKIESVYVNVNFKILSQTESIVRRLTYPDRDVKKRRNTLSTQLSYHFTNYARNYQLDSSIVKTEEEVIKLFEVLKLTSPYEKFRKTFDKIFNICLLERRKKMELCAKTFGNQLYGYKIDGTNEPNMQCQRLQVVLNQFEGRQNVAMIRCPIEKHEHFLGHFLSGGATKKTAVMYSQSEMYGKIYPASLAPDVPV